MSVEHKKRKKQPMELKMLVNTSFTHQSGDKGGVPVFSKSGIKSVAEALVFQDPNRHNVPSTFQKEKMEFITANAIKEQADEFNFDDMVRNSISSDKGQPPKETAKKNSDAVAVNNKLNR